MTLQEACSILFSYRSAAIAVALLSIIQIAPLKINPWSRIGKAVGRSINGEVIEKVDGLENNIRELKEDMDEDRAVTARVRILRFNDEILLNQKHTKDSFDQCLTDIDYDAYCEAHPRFRNNMTVMATENIKACYRKCLDQHDFL